MKNRYGGILVYLIMYFFLCLIFTNNLYAQHISKKGSTVISKLPRSTIKKLQEKYNMLFFFPPQSEYNSIGYSYDEQSKETVVLIELKKGEVFEVDRWNIESTLGGKINFAFIPNVGTDYGAIIIGFEPNPITDRYLIKVYNLKKRERVVSLWSSAYPLFADIDEDKETEVVIYKNVFAFDNPELPNWPVIVRFQKGLLIDDLTNYRAFIGKHLDLIRKTIKSLQDECETFESKLRYCKERKILDDECKLYESIGYCPEREDIKALELQENYLQIKLY